jgi:hypothetical protein
MGHEFPLDMPPEFIADLMYVLPNHAPELVRGLLDQGDN